MSNKPDKCPVCDMTVRGVEHTTQYHKMYFHFCSQQCLDNFNERPDLYLKTSIKVSGEISKHRLIRLSKPLNDEEADVVKSVLFTLMGVNNVEIGLTDIKVTYDLKQVREKQIEDALSGIELEIKNSWFEKMRRRMMQEHEENELDNLTASPGSYHNNNNNNNNK